MIYGVGIDLTPIDRIERALSRHGDRFERKVFTDGERAYCRGRARPADHFAARFAAKEAFLKALGVPEGLSWHEIEVSVAENGRPQLVLRGVASQAAAQRGVAATRMHLSLTHAGGMAAAVVVAEQLP